MQQGFKMPKKKDMSVREQVIVDLNTAGVQIDRDRKIISDNQVIFNNPETTKEVRAEILEDIVIIIEADLKHIEEARHDSPEIKAKESNPEYKKAMDDIVKSFGEGLADLKKARLEFIGEYTKT